MLVWIAVLVAALVVIDVVLVALAIARTAPASNGTAGPVPTFSSAPRPSVSPTPQSTQTANPAGMVTPGRLLLAAVDEQEAWRAASGTCGGSPGSLEHSVDGGATWTRVSDGIRMGAILALRADSTSVSVVLGTGGDCAQEVRTTVDRGRSWKDSAAGAAGAGIGPDGLILSSGTVAAPCANPTDVFQGELTTAVVCEGQVQWRSGDGAWVGVPVPGVRSFTDDGDSYLLAVAGSSTCSGTEIRSMPAVAVVPTTKSAVVGCAREVESDSALALARAGDALWLWSGDAVEVSADGGSSW